MCLGSIAKYKSVRRCVSHTVLLFWGHQACIQQKAFSIATALTIPDDKAKKLP